MPTVASGATYTSWAGAATLAPAPSGDTSGATDSAALRSLISRLGNGQICQLQAGVYNVIGSSPVALGNNKRTLLQGAGGVCQARGLGLGAATTLRVVGPGQGVTCIGGTTAHGGPVLRNFQIVGDGSPGQVGVYLENVSLWRYENVTCSDLLGAGFSFYGYNGGAVDATCYGSMRDCNACACTIGTHVKNANGVYIDGGVFDATNDLSGATLAGSTGVYVESGDTVVAHAVKMQGYSVGYDFQGGSNHSVVSPRMETFDTAFRWSVGGVSVQGGSLSNDAYAAAKGKPQGTAFSIQSGGVYADVAVPRATGCASVVTCDQSAQATLSFRAGGTVYQWWTGQGWIGA